MTDRLYYTDPYLTSFEAAVVSCERRDDGFAVLLDRSAFYPTSGGQPCDVGTLGAARVVEVIDREDGGVTHVIDQALSVGAAVRGEVDWRRRFDHMQQHSGQHVLSAAFDRLFQVRTESFHLGKDSSSIDLAREVTAAEVRSAEDEANRVVWEDRAVHIRFVSAEEATSLPLRKESLRTGPLRLIDIEGYDLSACGGTHVARTGGVGVIAIAGVERFKGGSRVQFLCGARLLTRFREWRDALTATGRYLSVQPADLAAAVEKLQLESKELQKTIRAQQEQLARHEARALVARATNLDRRRVVVEALDWDVTGLKALAAAAIAEAPDCAVALFGRATPTVAIVAAGTASGVDAPTVLRTLTSRFAGKGGGRRDLAQGGGFNAPLETLLAAARTALAE